MSRELEALFEQEHDHDSLSPWLIGKIPKHYKRITVDDAEAIRLAKLGASTMATAYGIKLFFSQAVIAGAVLDEKYKEIIIVTCSQYGKAIEDDELVLTRSGWKKHGDLVVGDEVISQNGEFVKVLHVHPKCEMDRIIVLETGEQVVCHHDHEWIVNDRNSKKNNVAVSTEKIKESIETTKAPRFRVPTRECIKGEEKELNVPPYVMGAWLGDGSTTKGQICSSPEDIVVLDECRKFYPEGSEWVHKDTDVITRSFIGLADDLSYYDMCFQRKDTTPKYIPEEYLTASIEQRLELLAGLIDTDGYAYVDNRWGKKTRMYFTTAGEKLKDTFEELVATFGWKTSTVRIEPKVSSSGIHGKRPYWVIGFNPTMDIPCRLERKRPHGFGKQKGTGIVEIRECKGIQGNCITVEGGTYRVGRKLIPTHNSWLMGHLGLYRAYMGAKQYIAGAAANTTQIIMGQTISATQEAAGEIRNALMVKQNEIDRLSSSVSKQRLAFSTGGFVEAITLGDVYSDNLTANRAVGRAGDFIIDEAALVSEQSFVEMGRREFAKIDGTKYKSIMISNPHKPGFFYDKLTQENPPEDTFILWLDALTAVEEERFTKEIVFNSDFAKHKSSLRRYLLCILDDDGEGMYTAPPVYEGSYEGDYPQYFLGVDAAYKGKDNIEMCLTATGGGKIHVEEVRKIEKPNWIEGKTSEDIIKTIARYANMHGAAMVCVDIGWGVWLVEGLIRHGVNAVGVNFSEQPTKDRVRSKHYSATNAVNKRAEMHLDFQDLTDGGVLEVSDQVYQKIKDVLPYITSERKPNGKIQIRPKSDIKAIIGHSPDEWDSVLLSIHAVVRYLGDSVYAIT